MGGFERNGIVIIDKPAHMTSAGVVAHVKRLLNAKKVGHAGTLDPFATGVLVCCINKATKLSRFLLKGWKKYTAVLHLGIETDTQDLTGSILSVVDAVVLDEQFIRSVFSRFEGIIEQVPPIYSALKHQGVPLYKLARKGSPVQKPARQVVISYNHIKEIHLPFICFETYCSSGTYIRTLCSDIGKALGCGGHLKELRRTESSGFTIKDAVTLTEFRQMIRSSELSIPMISLTEALRGMPEFVADEPFTNKFKHGHAIVKKDIQPGPWEIPEGYMKMVDIEGTLIGILHHDKETNRFKYIVSCIE